MTSKRPGIGRKLYRGFLKYFSEALFWVTKPARQNEPTGSFLLPKAIAPYFYPAICIAIVLTAAIDLTLAPIPDPATQAATTQGSFTLKQLIYKIVTIEPNLLGSATAGALFITPILYFASGGVSMLADFLKRREYEARNPETVLKLKEAERLLAEEREANARLQQENKELRERLGLNDDDC